MIDLVTRGKLKFPPKLCFRLALTLKPHNIERWKSLWINVSTDKCFKNHFSFKLVGVRIFCVDLTWNDPQSISIQSRILQVPFNGRHNISMKITILEFGLVSIRITEVWISDFLLQRSWLTLISGLCWHRRKNPGTFAYVQFSKFKVS